MLKMIEALRPVDPTAVPGLKYVHPNFVYDPNEHCIFVNGAEIALAPKEEKLLKLFINLPNRLVAFDSISESLWGSSDCELYTRESIRSQIYNLRSKLKSKAHDRLATIEGIRGAGYIFNDPGKPEYLSPEHIHPNFKYYQEKRCIEAGERRIALSPTENKLLALLMSLPNKTVSFDELRLRLGGCTDPKRYSNSNITLYICKLRKKLNSKPCGESAIIAGEEGVGYKLVNWARQGILQASGEIFPLTG